MKDFIDGKKKEYDKRFLSSDMTEGMVNGANSVWQFLEAALTEAYEKGIKDAIDDSNSEPYEPYFGWCEVDGCENEGCSGGNAWRKTGYWTVCSEHSRKHREGKPQPKMKQLAIERENSRDKTTGFLPIGSQTTEDK